MKAQSVPVAINELSWIFNAVFFPMCVVAVAILCLAPGCQRPLALLIYSVGDVCYHVLLNAIFGKEMRRITKYLHFVIVPLVWYAQKLAGPRQWIVVWKFLGKLCKLLFRSLMLFFLDLLPIPLVFEVENELFGTMSAYMLVHGSLLIAMAGPGRFSVYENICVQFMLCCVGIFNNVFFLHIRQEARLKLDLFSEKQRAKEIAALKSKFLATVSHEIRTPMNSMLGVLSALEDMSMPKAIESHLKVCHRSAVSLMDILNDVLALSRAEAVGVSLRNVPFKWDTFCSAGKMGSLVGFFAGLTPHLPVQGVLNVPTWPRHREHVSA